MKKVLVTCGLLFSLSGWGQTLPYQNPELSPAERAKDLVKRLRPSYVKLVVYFFKKQEYTVPVQKEFIGI